MFDLNKDERIVWIFILCYASKKNSKTINIEARYISHSTEVEERAVLSAVQKLQQKQCITIIRASTPLATHATDVRTNDTNGTNDTIRTRQVQFNLPQVDAPGHQLFSIWNEFSADLPKVKGLNTGRKNKARMLWRENDDPKYWEEIVCRIAKSSFCRGKSDRGWVATFDWLLKPDTHLRVIEGKYDDRHSVNGKTDVEEHNRAVFERVKARKAKEEEERDVTLD